MTMKFLMCLGSGKINIMLTNNCTNEDGEYISSFVENGTGVYSDDSTMPNGWWYPSRESDRNPFDYDGGSKKQLENGDYIALTWGQIPKPILHDSFEIILAQLDGWIYDYFHRKGV